MSEIKRSEAERCAIYMKALADPTRIQIVRALRNGPLTVSDIAGLLNLELASVSHHLRVLYRVSITKTERQGRNIYYTLNPDLVGRKQRPHELNFGCCKLDLRDEDGG